MSEYIAETGKQYFVSYDGLRRSKHLEQIVRCRDCKYWEPPRKTEHETYQPTCIGLGGMLGQAKNEDGNGYCAWGERRDDA